MASIRLKRWFAPRTAASIQQGEDGYFIGAVLQICQVAELYFTQSASRLRSPRIGPPDLLKPVRHLGVKVFHYFVNIHDSK
jgi:hypothetical protein